jgi:hypothetical protein
MDYATSMIALVTIFPFNFGPPLGPWGKNPGTHSIGGWVGLRAGLDDLEKFLTLPRLEL